MPKKRRGARGDGYIQWDAKRQRWRATIPLPEGGSRTKYFGKADQAAAEEWRQEQLKAIKDKRDLRADRQLIKEAFAELLADRDYLRDGTRDNYRLYSRTIGESIGTKPVGDVQPSDIARMDRKHRETLTKAVADQILTLIATLYKRLMALRIVTFDPVAAYIAITPARARGGKPLRAAVKLDYGACRRILEHISPEYYTACAWFMVLGLRWGELCGLRRVNVFNGVVHIVEQRRAGSRFEPTDTKNEQSVRTLPYIDHLPIPEGGSDLLFVNPHGLPLAHGTFVRALTAACKGAKVPRIRPHDLRHTAASGVRRLGCAPDYVAQMLGHKRGGQTEDYAQGTEEELRPYIEKWAGLVLGEKQAKKNETGT